MPFSICRELTWAPGCGFPSGTHNVLTVGDFTSHHYILLGAFPSIRPVAEIVALQSKHTEEDSRCSV